MSLSAIIGILLNLCLPEEKQEKEISQLENKENEKVEEMV